MLYLMLSIIEVSPEFISMLEKFGIPMGILTAFSYFIAQSSRRFGSNVVVHMKDRHMDFLDNLEKCLDKITDSQLKICNNTNTIQEDVDRICDVQAQMKTESKIIKDKVDGLNTMVFQSMIQNGKYDSKIMSNQEIKKES